MAAKFSYGKPEKLKSRKLLGQLFKEGKTFSIFPVKVFYLLPVEPLDFFIKTGVGASSRHFKKAVDRNFIKRHLREAYRTAKLPLYECVNTQQKQITVFLLYIDKNLPEKGNIKSVMPQIIERLVKKINETVFTNT